MGGSGDHRTGDTKTLGNVPLHLRAQYQFGLQLSDCSLDREIVIGNERFEAIFSGQCPNIAGALAAVGTQPNDFKPHFVARHPRSRNSVGAIGKNKYPLAGEVCGVNGTAVPREPTFTDRVGINVEAQNLRHLGNEISGCPPTQRYRLNRWLFKLTSQPITGQIAHLGRQIDIGVCVGNAQQVMGRRAQRGNNIDKHTHLLEETRYLGHIVATPKSQLCGANQID